MAAHSKVGASGMYRWARCPGSVRLCADIPDKTSSYAEQGTRAHDVASQILLGQDYSFDGFEPDEVDAVQDYVDYIFTRVASHGARLIGVERRVDLSWVHEDAFGTADAILLYPEKNAIEVVDYKHGAGVYVGAQDNLQGLYYLSGAAYEEGLGFDKYRFTIVQPRHYLGGIAHADYNLIQIYDFLTALVGAMEEVEKPDAPLNPGSWCDFCAAQTTCPAKRQLVYDLLEQGEHNPMALDIEQLKKDYEKLPEVRAWVTAIERMVHNQAEQGNVLPGYTLEEKYGNRKWTDEAEETMVTLFGEDKVMRKTLLSPAQLEKRVKDAKGIVDQYTERPLNGTKLVKIKLPDGF